MATTNPIDNTCLAGITVSGGAVTINSGTNALNISTDASATTVNFATGAAVKTLTVGSTNTTSATALKSGSGNIVANSGFTIDSSGRTFNTVQPAFCGYCSGNKTNVTGDGTQYTIVFDSELFDQNSNFNTSTGTFTAPVTGKYWLFASVGVTGIGALNTSGSPRIVTTANTYQQFLNGPSNCYTTTSTNYSAQVGVLATMTAGDTATVTITINGGTKIVSVLGDASSFNTTFSGYLAC